MNYGFCIALVAISLIIFSCAQKDDSKVLYEKFEYLDKNWSKERRETFRQEPDSTAITDLHMSAGLWVRNNWLRNEEDNDLKLFFNSLGVFDLDAMSSIFFWFYHQKLNGEEIDVELVRSNAKKYYDSPQFKCLEKVDKLSKYYYQNYSINDVVTVKLPTRMSGEERSATSRDCPEVDWTFNDSTCFYLSGLITDKNDYSHGRYFKIEVKSISEKTLYFMRVVSINDTIELPLSLGAIEIERGMYKSTIKIQN
jgi:hypothetical protein